VGGEGHSEAGPKSPRPPPAAHDMRNLHASVETQAEEAIFPLQSLRFAVYDEMKLGCADRSDFHKPRQPKQAETTSTVISIGWTV
jgi:hypothetical protein